MKDNSLAGPGNPALVERLRTLLLAECTIPFDRFMGICLYDPDFGYYSRSQESPGRHGDFYTSVSTGPLFGRLLADHIADLWSKHFSFLPLTIIEQGAHGGRMALDILAVLQKKYPDLYASCCYICLEPRPQLRARQKKALMGHPGKADCYSSLKELGTGAVKAFFISNELVDSFPIRLLSYRKGSWNEGRVRWEDSPGGFIQEWKAVTDPLVLQEIEHWQIPAMEGYQAEICLEARNWMKELCGTLEAGFLLTMDYGFMAPELYSPSRPQGTLSCYSGHRRDDNPLIEVGEKDITAHINFSLLKEEGAAASWKTISFKDQHHALIEIAQLGFLREMEERMQRNPRDPDAQKAIRQFQTLTHPGIMGTQFKFLLQTKGI